MTEQIRLTGAQQTLLGPLYARALDNRRPDPVLGDETADRLLDEIDFDFRSLHMSSGDRMAVILRAKQLDDWVARYLCEHPDAVVLHLACGLDSRAFRLAIPASAQWYDIDLPDVIGLRQRLYPQTPANYRTIATSVTEQDWLDEIPTGRPTLIVAEGLTMYLTEADGVALLRRLVERFETGEMMFDAALPWTVSAARFSWFLQRTGATFRWGIGDPHTLELRVPGLRLSQELPMVDLPDAAKLAAADRVAAKVMNSIPALRKALRLLHFSFEHRPREKVELTGAQATMLATLYLRALDNRSAEPVLGDRHADEAVQRIDFDFGKFKMGARNTGSVTIRAKALDRWVEEALRPGMTVLHLGCGLDSRFERVDPPEDVEWYDIDQPDVIELRRRLFPDRPHHHTIGSSVTAPGLLDDIPGDRTVLVVAEGLTMYLSESDGLALLRRITEHFPSGELLFDAFSSLGVRVSNRLNPAVVHAGAHLQWGIDEPLSLESRVPGLRFVTEWSFTDAPELDRYPWPVRAAIRGSGHITAVRRLGRMLRYRF
ncbi:class I SAM-dependent methyltransferase [Saccharopolyspora phatthalungensis]|uniref:Methyltransferase (TIGR00027 family) n=1 Tax=Saccharopolyspora phatthalungensis TaxID=664693 RepID=A0A840QD49_9PSEU|nr:class I SAM-dependent methyltransferase [Saccharopolyspora phatthalungensis]MBB5154863.1 methyltransferase (TIGR00027 family) [Saccharopolyspora phatthalungensis]